MIDKFKYWAWKHWWIANFPFNGPTRFMALMRVMTVYDPLFKKEGFDAVRREHKQHLMHTRAMVRKYHQEES